MTDFDRVLQALGAPGDVAARYADPIATACNAYQIDTAKRQAAFLAQCAVETMSFRRIVENLNYSDPKRIAAIFRSGFDTNHDGVFSAEEIDFAKGFVNQPAKLANRVYANRNGNGDEASGDGWRFRGRGLIHLTGRANYEACGAALRLPLTAQPELLEQPGNAAMSGAWFWDSKSLNALADVGSFVTITRRITGGLTALAERQAAWAKAKAALGV